MAEHTKPGVLTNLRIKRVALVDVGANLDRATGDGAHIMLFKRADSATNTPIPTVDRIEKKEKPMKTLKDVIKGLAASILEPDAAKREVAAKAAAAALEAIEDEPKLKKMDATHLDAMKVYAKALSDTIKAFGEGPHEDTHPVHSMKRQYDDACTTLKAAGCDITEGTMKMDAEVAKRITAVEKENVDLKKRLDEQVEKGIRAEVTAILKSFVAVPLKLEGEGNDVDRYIEMFKSNKPLFDRQIELFKAADAQMSQSEAFKNVGKNGGAGNGDAWARIEAEADKLMEKSAGKGLSKEQAIEKIMLMPEHNKLVAEYRAQQQ